MQQSPARLSSENHKYMFSVHSRMSALCDHSSGPTEANLHACYRQLEVLNQMKKNLRVKDACLRHLSIGKAYSLFRNIKRLLTNTSHAELQNSFESAEKLKELQRLWMQLKKEIRKINNSDV